MTTLILGGTGFIGRHIAASLAASGETVVALHRGNRTVATAPGVVLVVGDRKDAAAVASIVATYGVTSVVDMIAMTVGATEPLLAALSGRVGRYVLVSSADVYRNYGGLIGLEAAEPETTPLTEGSALRRTLFPYRRDAETAGSEGMRRFLRDYDKIPIEAAVRGSGGFAWTILRLPMVYGPGDGQRRLGERIWRLRDGRLADAIDPAVAPWRTSYGYVANVGAAIALAARHPAAAGRSYNVAAADTPTEAEWLAQIAGVMGLALPARAPAAAEGVALDRFDPRFPLALDSRRIRSELGFTETVGVEEGLRATISDEVARGRPDGLEAAYRAEDAASNPGPSR